MSRPYIDVKALSYNEATNVLTARIKAMRIRDRNMAVRLGGSGMSGVVPLNNGWFDGTLTFSVNLDTATAADGPSSYTPATAEFTISGQAIAGDIINLNLGGGFGSVLGGSGYTFSATFTAADVAGRLASEFVDPEGGFSATSDGAVLTLSAPWGDHFNGLDAIISSTAAGISFAATFSEFSGGTTGQYTQIGLVSAVTKNGFEMIKAIPISVGAFTASREGV